MNLLHRLESRSLFDGGELDVGFGDGGRVTIDYAPLLEQDWEAFGTDFAEDRNGYVLVAARNRTPVFEGFEQLTYVTRLTPAGEIDTNFGLNGFVTLPADGSALPLVAVDGSARTYVYDDQADIVRRLDTRGRLDPTFGRRGKAKVPFVTGIADIAVDDDGHTYIFGSERVTSDPNDFDTRMAVVRLTTTGRLDTEWADAGVFRPPLEDGDRDVDSRGEFMTHVHFLDDGQVMFSGHGGFNEPGLSLRNVYVITSRLNPDGSPDRSYGRDGFSVLRKDATSVKRYSVVPVAFFPDGALLAEQTTSFVRASEGPTTKINVRTSADGSSIDVFEAIDPATRDQLGTDTLNNGVIQEDGRIVSAITVSEVARINPNGSLDTTWAEDGILTLSESLPEFELANDGGLLVHTDPAPFDTRTFISKYFAGDRPFATATARDVTAPRGGSVAIRVVWRDDDAVDSSTIDDRDLFVRRPDGTRRSARLASFTTQSDGSILAVYKLTSDDGTWDSLDDGDYAIFTRGGEVTDENGVRNLTGAIGTFAVNVD